MAEVKLMTMTDYAKKRGVSGAAVTKAVQAGRITLTDGKINPVTADKEWETNTRARAGSGHGALSGLAAGKDGSDGDLRGNDEYLVNRGRREAAEATIAETKAAEVMGKFLVKTEVDACFFEIARAMRDGLVNCSGRIAADVASLRTVDECQAVIDREHRALLTSMHSMMMSRLKVSAGDANA